MSLERKKDPHSTSEKLKVTFDRLINIMFPTLEVLEARLRTLENKKLSLIRDRQEKRDALIKEAVEARAQLDDPSIYESVEADRIITDELYAEKLKKMSLHITDVRTHIRAVRRHKTRFVI